MAAAVPEVFEQASEEALASITRALDAGRPIVFPTDTVFGIAARPDLPDATSALFDAKERPRELTLPVLVADPEAVRMFAEMDQRAATLAERFWPGPLTLILPRLERSRDWDLGVERDTVAVRVPDHPAALEVLRRNGPLATTSANLSGEPNPLDCEGVRASLGDSVAVYLCAEPSPDGTASTLVDLTGERPEILRDGPVSAEDVLRLLAGRR
ncbi:MAG: L-threonylcarbamoyladenylate synthase [Actinomycetota bacterium]